ncbi:MAG: YqgE/AlgH family protein [Puniceicoccaceae bacterium]|nr:MAG: YqgE/AlgH family protein [Puniceicoccaceae bacterium]
MGKRSRQDPPLAGSLLLAHPGLQDPNFRKTVVLLSTHGPEGSLGVVVNRPAGKTLGEFSDDFADSDLADIPLFHGGPVNQHQLILSAWKSAPEEGVFRLFFGLDPDKALELSREARELGEDLHLRAFLGYAGWGEGQLEAELAEQAWVVCPVEGLALSGACDTGLWRMLLGGVSPMMKLMADVPEDPSLN